MSNANLKVDLYPRQDENGNIYYIGRLKFKGMINFEEGVSFLVFTSDQGSEELQIAPMVTKI